MNVCDPGTAEPLAFLEEVTGKIEGWCFPIAAHLTIELLRAQRELDPVSGLLEIGVYKGKYLTVLLREAMQSGSIVAGVDTFQFLDEGTFRAALRGYFPNLDRILRIYNGPSTDLTPKKIRELLNGSPRFISVDGSHSAPDVEYDLRLAAEVTTESGIVSIDDFISPMALGVNEAVSRFFLAGGGERLSPFFYCTNKLFCCRPQYRDVYSRAAELFVRNHTVYPMAQAFVEREAVWRGSVEVEYFGHKVLIVH